MVVWAALAMTVGATSATAHNGNADAAHACQHGGWQNLVRSDGTAFDNQSDCVSYAAQGGTLMPNPACTAGSENFSEDAFGSQPTTFSGGTIDSAYGFNGKVLNPTLFSGAGVNLFRLTFTNAVGSVQVDATSSSGGPTNPNTVTLTAYDASNNVVGTASAAGNLGALQTLSVPSGTNNIKSFTVETNDPFVGGVLFTNIVWACN
jgi:hypothetical protein